MNGLTAFLNRSSLGWLMKGCLLYRRLKFFYECYLFLFFMFFVRQFIHVSVSDI
jgi:hypothetical protein